MLPDFMTVDGNQSVAHKSVITPELMRALREQYRCDWWGYHEIRHCARVRANTRLFRLSDLMEFGGGKVALYPGQREKIVCH